MSNLPISREEAWKLILQHNSERSDLNHYLESEAVMRQVAKHFGENEEYWGMLALLHDVDWGITKEDVKTHLTKAPRILKDAGFDDEFIQIILSHGYGFHELPHLAKNQRTRKIEWALAASETITGLIHSYALMRGSRVSDMDLSSLKKKFKDKAFARGVNREIIMECEKLGISPEEFFEIAIEGIKKIKEQVGLQ
jgi:putative nucleotidyltransferase with HDIG domain